MIEYKDCPQCGARQIRTSVRLCEVCETWERAEEHISTLTQERDEALQRAESAELGCDIAYKRKPTQAEGDAHEYEQHQSMGPVLKTGECFVSMGGWTGNRCRVCSRWVWGGPTACARCVMREERDEARAELALAKSLHDVAVSQRGGANYLLGEVERDVVKLKQQRDQANGRHREALDLCERYIGHLHKAEAERNEARARCETLRELADTAASEQGLAQRRMVESQRERDEARAALKRCEEGRRVDQNEIFKARDAMIRDGDDSRWQPGETTVDALIRERDAARAEVERLRNALAAISLDEYESTSSASEKVHGHARIARRALYGEETKP